MKKILLVEDDSILSYSIEYTLKDEGYIVKTAGSLENARQLLKDFQFDLIVLDVMLPDGNGYDFCKELREYSDISIIFLTACDEEANVVTGLDIGADDYITKPFRIRELISRIKAVGRRNNKSNKSADVLVSGNLKVHTLEGKVRKNNEEVVLTALEYRLLIVLIKHPKQILSRNKILELLWDVDGEFVDDNTLSVYIRRLRGKIEEDAANPQYIITYRGLGYKWDIEVK